MRKTVMMLLVAGLVAACGGGGGSDGGPTAGPVASACSIDGQKQTALAELRNWYLWNDLLPGDIDIDDYATPEDLVTQVTRTYGPQDANGNPLDRFSFMRPTADDQAFLGEGQFEGFGFSWRLVGNDVRILRAYENSPAADGGMDRGHRIIELNNRPIADVLANEGVSALFSNNETVTINMERLDGTTYESDITRGLVTIDPIPQWRLIDMGPGLPPAGYMELRTFISTADAEFDQVFGDFVAAGVNDVIIDMRYNGGGLLSTVELLGDYLGGFANDGRVFSTTEFNDDRAAANNSTSFFSLRGNSIPLVRFVVIATRSTASASELVTNGLEPWADVTIVGDDTFGKPVGQIAITFCEQTLRPTSFRYANAAGTTDFFDGLPVDCPAADDWNYPIGDDNDPNIQAAMTYLNTGACPVVTTPSGDLKAGDYLSTESDRPEYRYDTPQAEYLNAL